MTRVITPRKRTRRERQRARNNIIGITLCIVFGAPIVALLTFGAYWQLTCGPIGTVCGLQ